MKILKKTILSILALSIILTSVVGASAYVLFKGSWIGGVFYRTYYTAFSHPDFVNAVESAVADWNWAVNSENNGKGADVYLVPTSSQNGSDVQIWADRSLPNNKLGTTRLDGTTNTDKWWLQFYIVLNENVFLNVAREKRPCIVAHEIGHGLGLAHNKTDKGTLMWPTISTTAMGPTRDEVNGIIAKYS